MSTKRQLSRTSWVRYLAKLSRSKARSDVTTQPSRRWIPVTATIALAAVLLIAAIVILPHPEKTTTTTGVPTTSSTGLRTSPLQLTTSDYNSSLGIELTTSIARSTISENEGVSMYLSLDNTLAIQNNLTRPAGKNLPSSSYETCSQLPVGGAIFRGNYDVDNASQGAPLDLISPNEEVVNGCAGFPNSWSLAPMSNDLTYPTGPAAPAAMNMTYWGYWTNNGGEVFRPFSTGIYTIEGQDLWGQVTLLHFQVVVNENPLDCVTIGSNSSFAKSVNFSASSGPLELGGFFENLRANNTLVLEFSTTGNSTLSVGDPYTQSIQFGFGPFLFSPNSTQEGRWQYYSPNGTLGYPAIVYPNQCSLVSVTLQPFQSHFAGLPLIFAIGNQTQTFTINP